MKNTLSKKLLSVVLALMMIIPTLSMFGVESSAAYVHGGFDYGVNAWKTWSQGASPIIGRVKDDGTQGYAMDCYGCWIVADARMLCELGVKSSENFTPDDLYKWYLETGRINSSCWKEGDGKYHPIAFANYLGRNYLKYYKTVGNDLINYMWLYSTRGYFIIAKVYTGKGYHYVYVDQKTTIEKHDVYIYDSWSGYATVDNPKRLLDRNYSLEEIYVYEFVPPKPSGGTVTPGATVPGSSSSGTGSSASRLGSGIEFLKDLVKKGVFKVTNKGASEYTNTSATIELSASSKPDSWGFFISTDQNIVKNANENTKDPSIRKTVTTSGYKTRWDVAYNAGGDLKPSTTYYFKFWAKYSGQEVRSEVKSFTTTNNAPVATKLTVQSNSSEIGIGESATVNWSTSDDSNWKSRSYDIKLYDSNGNIVQSKTGIDRRATSFTFDPIMQAGTYSVKLEAVNSAGRTQATPVGTITVHPDVTVTYVDANPQSFVDWQQGDGTEPQTYVRTCTWGKAPEAPNFPSHDGYTFTGWDKDLKSVTEDTTVNAIYLRNSYTVNFVDEKESVLDTQSVLYYDSAVAPSYQTSEAGYVFTNWDKDYSLITGNTTVKAVTNWYNNNYSVFTTITSATRDSDNSGYDISITVTNNANTFTMGRAVVALKTEDGKLLTTTESSAFAVKAGRTRDIDVFVPYDNAAKKVYVYIVNDYKTMTPICTETSRDIDMGLEWTSWSTEIPAEGTYTDLESRTEYRYKTKTTTQSYATSMPGWVQDGYTPMEDTSKVRRFDFVSDFPSGFDKSNYYYRNYHLSSALPTSSESATQKTEVSIRYGIGYIYWHWCSGLTNGPNNRYINDHSCYADNRYYNTFHAFYASSGVSYRSNEQAYYYSDASKCPETYWWLANRLQVNSFESHTYNKLYNYYKISDWSDWTTENVANPEAVETRTVYRYKPVNGNVEDNSGVSRAVSGNLGSQYAGQELTLYIYKVDEASDYSNEYIGQTTISNDGSYSFTFKLREEPTVKTGDYTVALGLEGASSLIYLDSIEAPRNEYTVVYRDWDGTLLSTQTVYEGDDAVLPAESLYDNREGYHFTHWTTTNTNVKDNLEIFAEYEINKYTVVFVDWEARSVQIKEYEYGAPLTAPAFENADPGTQVVWDKIADGVTTVTQNMVVCTEYTPKVFDVVFRDFDGNIISQQNVTYGYAADVPDVDTYEDRIFLDWEFTDDSNEELESYIVTSKIDVCPKYIFNESCEPVYASVESGEYSETLSVELTTATENAVIYYTLDGSDPAGENGIKYTGPVTIRDHAKLNCYCVSLGKNDSGISSYNYIVNTDMTVSDYMRAEELPDYVQQAPAYYNVQDYTAYEFKDTVTVDTQADYDAYIADGWQPTELDYGEWSDWQDAEYTEWSEWSDTPVTATDTRQVVTRQVFDGLDYSNLLSATYYRFYRDFAEGRIYSPYASYTVNGVCYDFERESYVSDIDLEWHSNDKHTFYVDEMGTSVEWSNYYGSADNPWFSRSEYYAPIFKTQYSYRDVSGIPTSTDIRQVETREVPYTEYQYYRYTDDEHTTAWTWDAGDNLHKEIKWFDHELPVSSLTMNTNTCYYDGEDTVANIWQRIDYGAGGVEGDETHNFTRESQKVKYRYRDLTEPHFDYTDWTDWQDEPITDDGTRMGFETDTREYEYEFTTPSFKYSRWVYNDNGVTKYSHQTVSGFNGTWEYSEIPQSETQYRLTGMNPNTYTASDGGIWFNKTASTINEMRTKTQYRSRYQTATLYKWDDTSFSMSIPQGETRESRPISVYTYTPVKHHFVTVIPAPVTVSANGFPVDIIADGEKLTEDIYPELYGYTPYKLYTDAECTDEWNLASDTVTGDVTLYAAYTPVKFNVTFAYEDGTVIETQSVNYLGSATAPATIELPDGYILLGWDSDAYESVTEDMVIHARAIHEDEYATVNISNDELSLLAGSRTTLTAETSVPGKDIIWTSSDDSIATVENGVITGMSAGTVTVTATVADSGESDTCTVTVLGNPSIQLCLTTASVLGYDSLGYLRGVNADGNTVDSVKPEFANPAAKLHFYDIADAELTDSGLVGTGTTVKLVVEGEELDSKVFVVTGDMTGDGIINNRDVAMMNRYLVDMVNPADYQILAVDVNGDGSVNNRDAAMLARYLVGKETLA